MHTRSYSSEALSSASRPEPLQVTISEAARLLAYDARTIRRLIARGEIAAVGAGRMRRIPMRSLHDYQQRHLGAGSAGNGA